VLAAFGIPVVPGMEARSANEALVAAQTVGLPVAMKISSPQITHKSDVGGVRLNISNAHDVRTVYTDMVASAQRAVPEADVQGVLVERMFRRPHGRELLVGVIRDPVFGPVVTFGAGGTAVEILRDRAVALPPLNSFIAHDMIGRTKIARSLDAFRNLPPVDKEAIVDVLLRVSAMVCEIPHIQEVDINPLVSDEEGVLALDARIGVAYPPPAQGPYDHVAIHPYPRHLETKIQLSDGTDITIRPVRPEDAEIKKAFWKRLSPESKFLRFGRRFTELTTEMLVRFTQIDYNREMALIATTMQKRKEVEIAVARYKTNPDGRTAEFAVVVADDWQHKGIGSRILRSLISVAKAKGIRELLGEVHSANAPTMNLLKRLGFTVRPSKDESGTKLCQLSL
jgi:acetyltransferase